MWPPGPVIAVVHLPPLPGSPGFGGRMAPILDRAVRDAETCAAGGVDALILENYGDAPFLKEGLAPETVAALALSAAAVRAAVSLPLGVNALRNDARAALGVAVAAGARFIRVNVHAGIAATDQGLIEGGAARTLRARKALGADVRIAADVHVKHGRPLFGGDLAHAARDLVERNGADAVIVSGVATGEPTEDSDLRVVRAALPEATIFAGSGVTRESVGEVLSLADAVIVGTALKRGGKTSAPADAARVRAFVKAAKAARRKRRRSR